MMLVADPMELQVVRSWFPSQKSCRLSVLIMQPFAKHFFCRKLNESLAQLKLWNMLRGQDKHMWLDKQFQASLLVAFGLGVREPSSSRTGSFLLRDAQRRTDHTDLTLEQLEEFSQTAWTSLLLKMVDAASHSERHLFGCGLEFFLETKSHQLWTFLLHYLEAFISNDTSHLSLGLGLQKALAFLFQCALAPIGQRCTFESLDPWLTQAGLLAELHDIGLIYYDALRASFYPTELCGQLLTGSHSHSSSLARHDYGYLFLETNFKVYAYTSNPLIISILALFVSLRTRFPNFICGTLTRDSVLRAFSRGIKASQIVHFLEEHVHPYMCKFNAARIEPVLPTDKLIRQFSTMAAGQGSSSSSSYTSSGGGGVPTLRTHKKRSNNILPVTLVDQIYLWESEKNRVKRHAATLYNQFLDTSEYERAKVFAEANGFLLLALPEKRCLVVSQHGHQVIKAYMQST